MDQIASVLKAILNGVKSPKQAVLGAIGALFLYFFILVQKGELREKKADSEKEDQKKETNSDLEAANAKAEADARDRLERRKTKVSIP